MDIVVNIDTHKICVLDVWISFFVWHVAACVLVSKPLTMSKVNHVNNRALIAQTDHKIF